MSQFLVRNRGVIQLFSAATPNGIKVAACLEEIHQIDSKFHFETHSVNILQAENRTPEFLDICKTGKIPVIIDPHGPAGRECTVFESGAILLYLAEKSQELIPNDPVLRVGMTYLNIFDIIIVETINWLFWGSTGISSQFKLFGFYYKYCPHNIPYCVARYTKECNRLFEVLEKQLGHGRHYIIGGNQYTIYYIVDIHQTSNKDMYTIADLSIWPWIFGIHNNYGDAMLVIL